MKSLIVLVLLGCFALAFALPQRKWVHECNKAYCPLPDCQCSQTLWWETAKKPQFVVLSFDDAVSEASFNDFIKPMIASRTNPDGCRISGTFFVPHEYTNYSIVNQLYKLGFEIGSHSVTKNFSQEYWNTASIPTLVSEFSDQRTIISTFANISSSEIIGVRVPQLQLSNNTFLALHKAGFQYDASWPTQQPFFPYTLDYTSTQECHVQECQVQPTPGLWEMPIVNWKNGNGISCNSVHACAVEENIFEWMKENFDQIKATGAHVSLRLSYSWLLSNIKHRQALSQFFAYLRTQAYIVSYKQLLEWSRNPTEKVSFCRNLPTVQCNPVSTCLYQPSPNGNISFDHYIGVCGKCPQMYPWLNNPLGEYKYSN